MQKTLRLTSLLLLLACWVSAELTAQCQITTVSLDGGNTFAFVCSGDGNADNLSFTNSGATTAYAYAITDGDNNILMVTTDSSVDFDGAGVGTCRVWGFSYDGDITAGMGENVFNTQFSTGCWNISQNAITVNRSDSVSGGTVSTVDGATDIQVCFNYGQGTVSFQSMGASGGQFTYVVTDENNNILGLPGGNAVDFTGAGPGVCRLWGLSFTGNVLAAPGDNAATTTLTDGCFALSENFVTVRRGDVDGGTIDSGLGGYVEIDDGDATDFDFSNTSTASANYAYVLTDAAFNILAVSGSDDNIDTDDFGPGKYFVWGVSFAADDLSSAVGQNLFGGNLSDGCTEISANALVIQKNTDAGTGGGVDLDGGTVSTAAGETEIFTCVGDGNDDFVSFDSAGVVGPNFTYVVTDEDNNILGLPGGDVVNFEGAGIGNCRLWGLAYSGTIIAMAGDNAATATLTDGDFMLSNNFVTVNRDQTDGGTVATVDGETAITITTVGDGTPDEVDFTSMGTSNSNFTYVVTDSDNNILGLPGGNTVNFDGAGPGECRVWGLSYTGTITAGVGDNAATTTLSSDCFDLSDNFVTVTRIAAGGVSGGTVSTEAGETDIFVCVNDDNPDLIAFDSAGVAGDNFTYVVTDSDNNILGLPGGDVVDFEGAGVGVCRLWGLAFTGNVTAMVGDNAATTQLTDGMFMLSSNFVTVNRDETDGGSVTTVDGDTLVLLSGVGDGMPNVVEVVSTGASNSNFSFVVTDDQNNILGLPQGNSIDFDGAGPGTCRIWGLAFTGNVLATVGDNAATTTLTDGCFDLSDNFVTVVRDTSGGNPPMLNGGTVSTEAGETEIFTCAEDGNDDFVSFDSTGVQGANFTYVVTDDQNNILGLPGGDKVNFAPAGIGICRLWGLAFTGNVIATPGMNAATADLTDGTWMLSSNFVTVNRDDVQAGTVATTDGDTSIDITTVSDGTPDTIAFMSMGNSNSNFTYVVTDDQNIILGLPPGNVVDFDGAGVGACRVWGLAYTGSITAAVGDNAAMVALTDDCFDLSDNFVTVNRSDDGLVGDDDEDQLLSLSLAPNPAQAVVRVAYEVRTTAEVPVSIRLVGATGTLYQRDELRVGSGTHTHEMTVAQLPAGVYFITVQDGDQVLRKRFLKL